jgi:V/A-type H+-transporting ATPase subunit E
MELQIQELLQKIQSEGVDAARAEADKILADARISASALIEAAKRKAEETESESRSRIESAEKASRLALVQASRDTILGLREKVQAFMNAAVLSTVKEAFGAQYLATLLPSILGSLIKDGSTDLTVLLAPKVLAQLDSSLASRLSSELGAGITFKPFAGIDAGFRVTASGSSAHYDFSAETVAQILASRVNSRLAECVQTSLSESATP